MVFAIMFNLLTQLDLATEWQQIVKGAIILGAVLIQRPERIGRTFACRCAPAALSCPSIHGNGSHNQGGTFEMAFRRQLMAGVAALALIAAAVLRRR